MDRVTAEKLAKVNEDFYASCARSFSATRGRPWAGWGRCLSASGVLASVAKPVVVLDLACGNLRFARYVHEKLPPEAQLELFAVDNCEQLLPVGEEELANSMPYVRFQKLDVVQRLLHGANLNDALEAAPCDLAACFGFMHHVPGAENRAGLLDALIAAIKRGGTVAVSFWKFMDCEELAQGAKRTHGEACAALAIDPALLEPGDYLLGWKGLAAECGYGSQGSKACGGILASAEPVFAPVPSPAFGAAPGTAAGPWRYCHYFSDAEIDALVEHAAPYVEVLDRFKSDGRTGALNEYLVLRRR